MRMRSSPRPRTSSGARTLRLQHKANRTPTASRFRLPTDDDRIQPEDDTSQAGPTHGGPLVFGSPGKGDSKAGAAFNPDGKTGEELPAPEQVLRG